VCEWGDSDSISVGNPTASTLTSDTIAAEAASDIQSFVPTH